MKRPSPKQKDRKELLTLLANQAPAVMWSSDRHLRFTSSFGAGLKHLGLIPNQVVGMSMYEFFKTTDPKFNHLRRHLEALKGKSSTYEDTWAGRFFHIRIDPLRDAMKRVIGTLGLALDLTERRQAEEALRGSLIQMRRLAARLQFVREEERRRIALDIHDRLGQALTSAKLDVASLSSACRRATADERKRLDRTLHSLDSAIQTVRRISTGLRPAVLDRLGLKAAIEWQAREFQSLTGVRVRLTLPSREVPLNPDKATAAFRIFQELLTNVARHAKAGTVEVFLSYASGKLLLTVKDDGRGISEKDLKSPASFGLLGMEERAPAFDGDLRIHGRTNIGTTAFLRIPICQSCGEEERL